MQREINVGQSNRIQTAATGQIEAIRNCGLTLFQKYNNTEIESI